MGLVNTLFMSVWMFSLNSLIGFTAYDILYQDHESVLKSFVNDDDFDDIFRGVDWDGSYWNDQYLVKLLWSAFATHMIISITTLILTLSSYRFLQKHVFAKFKKKTKLSVTKNDAGVFDNVGCWLFLTLTVIRPRSRGGIPP